MAEASPLQPVRDSCRRLWQEWEHMMNNAESATNQLVSSFRTQQEDLMMERAQVAALKQEVADLRRSVFQKTEEERKATLEMVATEHISRNISIQFAELKRVQCQVAKRLVGLNELVAEIRNPKLDKDRSKPVRLQNSNKCTALDTKMLEEEARLATVNAGLGSHRHLLEEVELSVPERVASLNTNQSNLLDSTPRSLDIAPDNFPLEAVIDKKELSDASTLRLKSGDDDMVNKPLRLQHGSHEEMNFEIAGNLVDCQVNDHQGNLGLRTLSVSSGRAASNCTISGLGGLRGLKHGKKMRGACTFSPEFPDNQPLIVNGATKVSKLAVVVKSEPLDEELPFSGEKFRHGVFSNSKVKSEFLQGDEDELDHILLSERLELLRRSIPCKNQLADDPKVSTFADCHMRSLKRKACHDDWKPSLGKSGFAKSVKRYKVPIEAALQEDAPGLLEKLQEKGLLQDIGIYGDFYDDVCGDIDSQQDAFKDLENVASKLWGTPTGLFKVPHIARQHSAALNKGPTYCLACLTSLIEQTKSLKQRNWPVEWGWCRQLQAFLFVFDKHNRIVLERPEYGHATYFFELVQVLPVNWQVGRLIRVMSVTALGKTALLENRPLELGQDLTVNEARILKDYGWTQNTGLGSFLNFCDRVVHDVKEDDNADWRQKIGKCLMDGHDRGRIAVQSIPQKLQMILGYDKKIDNDRSDECLNDGDIKPKFTE